MTMSLSTEKDSDQCPQVTILSTRKEKDAIAPSLARLSSTTEMSSYGEEQWKFLLYAGNVEVLVLQKPDSKEEPDIVDLLGCVLRIAYGSRDYAYGMMLVSREARGLGLGRTLLETAMNTPSTDPMHILGTCTELGRPMYEKMGFERVSTVTRMSAGFDKLCWEDESILPSQDAVQIEQSTTRLDEILAMDLEATGLDRSETLRAIHGYPFVLTATIVRDDKVVVAALMTLYPQSPVVVAGPILGQVDLVPTLLQGIRDYYKTASGEGPTQLALIVSDHAPLVQILSKAKFETNFELGAMTMKGVPFPGKRDSYIALIHPTLG